MAKKKDQPGLTELIFEEYKKPYTHVQAVQEADRCLFCTDAPCMQACPTHIDVPQFIRKITTNNIRGSAHTIFEANVFGRSCARACPVEELCVGACVYNKLDIPPIQVGKLQRYSTDIAYDNDWRFFTPGEDTGKHVGIIGGGPAGLACAHELRRHGHGVTIYEKRDFLGGLNTTDIAPYKMKSYQSLEEIERILNIGGINIKTLVNVGKDCTIEDLEQRHDALFLGFGLGNDALLNIPGEKASGIIGAVKWIEHMKLKGVTTHGIQHCIVIGAGNTAIDAVREACGLGIPNVTMLYRGAKNQMSGFKHEWEAAQLAGAKAEWHTLPVAFVGKPQVTAIKCIRLDASKKIIPGSEFEIPAELVLVAIGQAKQNSILTRLKGIKLDNGRIVTDINCRTGRKGVFAGGDCRNGGMEVVNAVAEGKTAALAIHDYLTKENQNG